MIKEPLNKAELELIAQLLELASNDFENHGCNDFNLENTQANRFLMLEYQKDNNPNYPDDLMFDDESKVIYGNDSALMSYMARRAKTIAESL